MKIHMNKNISLMLLISGIFYAIFIVLSSISSGNFFFIDFIISIILIVGGFISRGSTYFELGEHSLILRNMFGGIYKEYQFSAKSDFTIKGKNVILSMNGKKGEKLYGFSANKEDWAAFLKWINES